MDERLRKTLLYDFYGELLNEHQRNVYSAAIFDDMNYSEISDEFGCSRQAAFDLVKRIDRKLEGYESRLGLLGRFLLARDKIDSLKTSIESVDKKISTSELSEKEKRSLRDELSSILSLSNEVIEEF
ncbi:MAG: DNA-binding protein [Eubacterium sp.]|nr:DNA-binding protein [Eubacterium sp.]